MSSDQSKQTAQPLRLTPAQLVERWQGVVSLATLATWRSRGGGPSFVKIGRQPLYPIEAIEEYERQHQRR